MSDSNDRPFRGVRVVDVTHVLAGPFCAYQLALLGADVIKVESPASPDVARGRGPDDRLNAAGLGINYMVQGSNKRSIAIDLASDAGRSVFLDLVASSDVLVENFRCDALDARGLGAQDLLARNPRLVHCSISGFGRGGDRAQVNAYDNVIQAASGLMAQTRAPDGQPMKSGASHVDYTTGYVAAFAIAAALFQRTFTGRGQTIDCSMFETALSMMAPEAAAARYSGEKTAKPKEAGLGTYETADGLLTLGAFNVRQNRRLWQALGRPDFAALDDWPGIWREAAAMRAELEIVMRRKTAAEWEAALHAIGVPAERVRSLDEAVAMPHLVQRGFFQEIVADVAGTAKVVVPLAPFTFAAGGPAVDRLPPRLGEHTDEVLQTLGHSKEEIGLLRAAAAIA